MFTNVLSSLTSGFYQTLFIFTITLLGAIPLGVIICQCSLTKFRPLRWLTRGVVWCIRGTPLMLQMFVILYVPGIVFDVPMKSRMTAVLIAFIINYATYFSEIYRAGIQSIPLGQFEAAQVLGMSKYQTFFKVILMQVIKRIIPPMSNEIITLVKDTSLARVIGIAEVVMCAERFTKQGLIWPLFFTGLYYLIFVGALTLLFSFIEKKLDYYR
ncbi:MAG: amino acid ABC transporter permease [Spirochaetales bacterium]|nr:amino acid ABC transporter permease [Spirochaetales bacterium]